MHERADLAVGPLVLAYSLVLRSQLADPRRPVAERGPGAGPVARTGARAQQVVAGSAREERASPGRVVAGVGDVLARDPDRVAVHRSCTVVPPAWADRDARVCGLVAPLSLVAREAVFGCSSLSIWACERPRAGADKRVNRSIGGTWISVVARVGERHHTTTARRNANCRVRQIGSVYSKIALEQQLARRGVDDVVRDAGAVRPTDRHGRVERAPQLPVRKRHLLHPRVIRVELGD